MAAAPSSASGELPAWEPSPAAQQALPRWASMPICPLTARWLRYLPRGGKIAMALGGVPSVWGGKGALQGRGDSGQAEQPSYGD